MPETLVPDTSVLVDGRITELLRSGEFKGACILVPRAALAELEAQANRGLETGVAGLDELATLQDMARADGVTITLAGTVPTAEQLARADQGAIDSMVRQLAETERGVLVTSDRVQAHAARAQGLRCHYIRPIVAETPDFTRLRLWSYFDDQTMSVHLKDDCLPMAKRGRPGAVAYEPVGTTELEHKELRAIIRECIEHAKRDYQSFIEIERKGCTVLQLGPMRITIAQPPFSDGVELTAVRPVTRKSLPEYALAPQIEDRLQQHSRGVFIAGPPGSGKSTFAAAVAEHLHGLRRVVKTMEQPRDLQVPKEVTQYGALDRDMKWTGDILLLVRPDHVIYDEVRTTDDFRTFADMRLAGVGLIGVTHSNRAIDAIQRLIGRVELGMIPQVVDTVIFIDAGAVAQILEIEATVKVPAGMSDEDLARPVVVVRDVLSGRPTFELYTFGEQVVVMPLDQVGGGAAGAGGRSTGAAALAERELTRALRRNVQGPLEVKVVGQKATVYVEETEVPQLIGRGGRTVQMLERKLGIHLDIKPLAAKAGRNRHADRDRRRGGGRHDDEAAMDEGPQAIEEPRGAAKVPRVRVRRTGSNVFVFLDDGVAGGTYQVSVGGAIIGEATASQQGRLRFKADSAEGMALLEAEKSGLPIDCDQTA